MSITTKGHIVNIDNDTKTTNSWDGKWNNDEQKGDIATINTTENPNEPGITLKDNWVLGM